MVKIKDYKKYLLKQLRNSEEAAAYFYAALNDDDPLTFPLALSDLMEEAELHKDIGS